MKTSPVPEIVDALYAVFVLLGSAVVVDSSLPVPFRIKVVIFLKLKSVSENVVMRGMALVILADEAVVDCGLLGPLRIDTVAFSYMYLELAVGLVSTKYAAEVALLFPDLLPDGEDMVLGLENPLKELENKEVGELKPNP
jgi:hypothetical protein